MKNLNASVFYDLKGGLRAITQVSGNEQSTTSMDYYADGNLCSWSKIKQYSLFYLFFQTNFNFLCDSAQSAK